LQPNKLHRIYINNNITINSELTLDSDTHNHIKNVLRIKNNSDIIVFNGDGKEYLAEVNYTDKSTVSVKQENLSREIDKHNIILAQSVSSAKHMNLAIQKSVEIGINKIVPIISERSHPGDYEKKYSHWKNIIIHSTEQSNGLFLAELDKIMKLEDFLIQMNNNMSHKICFHMSGRKMSQADKKYSSHVMLIGPEGGFSNSEIRLIERYNWNIIGLGDRILRTETAAIVAQTLLRDF